MGLAHEVVLRSNGVITVRGPYRDFPGGSVVKNLPSNAEDMGLILGWGTKIPHDAVGHLSPCTATREPAQGTWISCVLQLLRLCALEPEHHN